MGDFIESIFSPSTPDIPDIPAPVVVKTPDPKEAAATSAKAAAAASAQHESRGRAGNILAGRNDDATQYLDVRRKILLGA